MDQLNVGNVFDIMSKNDKGYYGKVDGTYMLVAINKGFTDKEHENDIQHPTASYVFWSSPFSKGPGELRLGYYELEHEYDIELNHLTVQPPLGGKKNKRSTKNKRSKKQRRSRRRS